MKSPMTRKDAVIAYVKGEPIEWGTRCNGVSASWFPVTCYGDFDIPSSIFRLKPGPVECWVTIATVDGPFNGKVTGAYDTLSAAEGAAKFIGNRRVVHMREVTE